MVPPDRELSIIVVGASGDLACRKIFPALFSLYCQDLLPERLNIVGFARTPMTDEAFRARITEKLTCRYAPGASCADRMDAFLGRCRYVAGQYGSRDAFLDLFQVLQEVETERDANRMYYLAVPPSVFFDVAQAVGGAGLVRCGSTDPWSRVVIEKPFGRDRASSDTLTRQMGTVFRENQTYRIDHYLGKEVVQNLMVLRFANRIFEPIWNREHIRGVQVAWQEKLSVEGRGGYFDNYGIIRDVMQNHLLQIVALLAMEPPGKLDGHSIRDEKVRVLRSVPPVRLEDIVVGQYAGMTRDSRHFPGYTEDLTVPEGSLTPTYAAAALQVQNDRWRDVPFLITAGKALDAGVTEIRVHFRPAPGSLFGGETACPPPNELVIRVQPQEGIYFGIVTKVPGLGMELDVKNLDLSYTSAFSDAIIPDAYESLLLDVVRGEKTLFIRDDELEAAWDIFTPALKQMNEERVVPESYAFGGAGPDEAMELARRHGLALR
jgi:glucose-6-phosphate 1-dehydrogenase